MVSNEKRKKYRPVDVDGDIRDYPVPTMKRLKKKKSEMSVFRPRYIRQRAKYGFCEYDAMFILRWFCRVLPDMLEYMADNLLSCPSRLMYEYWERNKDVLGIPSYLDIITDRIDDDLYEKILEEACKEWQEILRRMAHLFRESFDGELPGKKPTDKDYDFIKEKEYQENCMREGLELFSKWFGDLWA